MVDIVVNISAVSETVAGLLAAGGPTERGENATNSPAAGNAERVKEVFGSDPRSADALVRTRQGEPDAVGELASALAWYARHNQAFAGELVTWAAQAGSTGGVSEQDRPDKNTNPAGAREMSIAVVVGVAANLVTGLIIALALLLDHYYRISQGWIIGPWVTVAEVPSLIRWVFAPPLWVAYVLGLLVGGAVIWWQARKPKPSLIWVSFAVGLSGGTILALIGYAAGVK